MMRGALLALITEVCAAAALADAPAPPPAALPTPYSAEQIRDAWQPGFRVEMRSTEAGVATLQRMTVVSATAEAVTIRSESLGENGEASEPASELTAKWAELRDHGLFEATKATRERAECHSRLGSLPGWRYATTTTSGDALTMCFADATPGPPVEYETRREGKLLSRTEHIHYGRPVSGAEEKP
jgi:hypothetical protein